MTIIPISISIIIIMTLILIGWTWNCLGNIEKPTKALSIIIGVAIIWIFTFIIFSISKIGINYEDKEVAKVVRRVFVIIFTIINGYLTLPFAFKQLNLINNDEAQKDKIIKNLIILLIIMTLIFIFESIYMGNMQKSIIELMQK